MGKKEKVIPVRTSPEKVHFHYLQLLEGIVHLSPLEKQMLAECMKHGPVITTKVRYILRDKFGSSAQDIATFIFKMLKKKCIVKDENGKLYLSKVLILDLEQDTLELDVVLRFKL